MYEPLNLEGSLSENEVAAAIRELGGEPARIAPLQEGKHVFSHIEWRMRAFLVECEAFPAQSGVWGDAEEYAIPSAFGRWRSEMGDVSS
jgi:A/G-specific adenine glycosylase